MKDEEADAKHMYFEYACRTFFMANDGVYDEYMKFGISEAQEKEWRREYIALWVSRLEIDDLTPVDQLRNAWAGEALPALIEMADKGDSYSKLWYATAIWQLANGTNIDMTLRWRARKVAVDLWQSLQTDRVELTEGHRAHIASYLPAIQASTPEEYIRRYARQKLESSN
jgi:hypothetical protein